MELLNPIVPWNPLVTRSIIHLLENTHADNTQAYKYLGYEADHHWKIAIRNEVNLLIKNNGPAMKMTKQVN